MSVTYDVGCDLTQDVRERWTVTLPDDTPDEDVEADLIAAMAGDLDHATFVERDIESESERILHHYTERPAPPAPGQVAADLREGPRTVDLTIGIHLDSDDTATPASAIASELIAWLAGQSFRYPGGGTFVIDHVDEPIHLHSQVSS